MADRTPFQPTNDVPVWRPLYDESRNLDYGTLLTYERLNDIVGHDVLHDRGPIYRAMKELERHDSRTLICEPTVGYRIANPDEHFTLAEKHRKRSYRQITKSRRRIHSAPRNLLPEDEVRRLDEMDVRMSQYEMGLKHVTSRVSKLERKDAKKDSALAQVQDALAALRAKGLID